MEHAARRTDVHQHLWPAELIDALRRRTQLPYLRGWTLHTAGEPPYEVAPTEHDPELRAKLDPDTDVLLSLSTPLGIEALPPHEAAPLLAAWHDGVGTLGRPYRAWAAVTDEEPDLETLGRHLHEGFVGLQLSAHAFASPVAIDRIAPVLRRCEELGRPVLIHPGPARHVPDAPAWWPAVVDYPAQLQAAWWAWHAHGRASFPRLRLCFVAGAGLAPVHHERFSARGGGRFVVDHDVFVDTSSYARQGVDALTRVLGIDVVVLGSDRPYAEPVDVHLGDAARHAIGVTNPLRLLRETERGVQP